ncbi:hypothetical protein M409DRAFT_59855 [Zasmidium cellare ATCC 36951]|uniref:Uncharacterized protein n=1 Tax=Zasmidium cellare ATCC 36951 TaxID=1080233 RepID=A0A6A6C419_ZASCE|nr:uncharacterized protein M409DRAFT_59855 [Zasmidium cellare ATCC 36951]KAF2160602.1 hypothetical protein M409DRAFT_59855 [Zasmidium cellare ATCC 36951]
MGSQHNAIVDSLLWKSVRERSLPQILRSLTLCDTHSKLSSLFASATNIAATSHLPLDRLHCLLKTPTTYNSSNTNTNSRVAGDTVEMTIPNKQNQSAIQANMGRINTHSAPASKKRKCSDGRDASEQAEQGDIRVAKHARRDSHQETNDKDKQTRTTPNAPSPKGTMIDLTGDEPSPKTKQRKLGAPFEKWPVELRWYEEDYTLKTDAAKAAISQDKKSLKFWQEGEEPYFTIQTASIKNLEEARHENELVLTRAGEKTFTIVFTIDRDLPFLRTHGKFFNVLSSLGNDGKGTDRLQKDRADAAARSTANTNSHDVAFVRQEWKTFGDNDWKNITRNDLRKFCRWADKTYPGQPFRGISNIKKPDLQSRIIDWLTANPNEGVGANAGVQNVQPKWPAYDENNNLLGYYITRDEAAAAAQQAVFESAAAREAQRIHRSTPAVYDIERISPNQHPHPYSPTFKTTSRPSANMADYKSMKTGALSIIHDAKTYNDKVDINTLMLQLELDATHNLSATVSFYFKKASNTEGSKKRNRQVMAALEQQQPGDILHKGLVAETLVPFVHIGKASHRQATEQSEPCTARAYGIVAHCVLKSIKYLPNAKASGIYTPTGKIAIKLENFELPNEGWSPSWDGSGKMVPCMFGIRVLEKIQMMEPAVMAPLDEEDQEDFESGLEDEMVDEEIREYVAAKETAAAEKAAALQQERDAVLGQIRKAKNELKALDTKQAAMKKERHEMADFDSEGFAHHRSPARDQELKVNIEQIGKQKSTTEDTLRKATHQLNVMSKRTEGALLAADEPAVVTEPEVEPPSEEEAVQAAAPQVEPAQEEEGQAAAPQAEKALEEEAAPQAGEAEEKGVQATSPQVEQAQEPAAPPSPPPVAGKKRSREDTGKPDCDERSKKSNPNLMPPPSHITGVKRSREDDGPQEVVTKKARTASPAQEKDIIAESISPLTGQPSNSDIAAVASVEKQKAEKSEASSKQKPLSKGKGKADLVRVVNDAIKSRHKKQVVASQIARRQEAANVAQRAGIAAMKSAYVPGSGGRKMS